MTNQHSAKCLLYITEQLNRMWATELDYTYTAVLAPVNNCPEWASLPVTVSKHSPVLNFSWFCCVLFTQLGIKMIQETISRKTTHVYLKRNCDLLKVKYFACNLKDIQNTTSIGCTEDS